jgi:hypothetical protein
LGAKTWMLVCSDAPAKDVLSERPTLDRVATEALAKRLFPDETLIPIEDGNLAYTSPPDNQLFIGCFDGLTVVAAKEFGIDYPSTLPVRWLQRCDRKHVYLHAMHSVVDWFAFAVWENRSLVRTLSLSPDSGVLEDIGERLAFEEPYWGGQHPLFEPGEEQEYPFVFHPLDLGEEALSALFGYILEGYPQPQHIDPEDVPLLAFRRQKRRWWRIW